jgi:DNA polymerase III alpha subunit
VVENLIYVGAFREFGDVRQMFKEYHLAKNKMKPVNFSAEELELKEIEMIGLCLSQEPICKKYHELIVDNDWSTISEHRNYKRLTVFGRIEMIDPRTSKAGNSMYVVRISDGLDKLQFFVFKAAMEYFRESVRKGQLVAVPLDKFDDSDTRFFNDRGEVYVVNES